MLSSTVGGAEAASVAGAGGTRTSPEYQGGMVVFFSHMATPALRIVVLLIRAIRAGHRPQSVPGGHDGHDFHILRYGGGRCTQDRDRRRWKYRDHSYLHGTQRTDPGSRCCGGFQDFQGGSR